jgi:hypothetical protein
VENEVISDEHVKTSLKERLTNLELNFERYFLSFDEAEHRQKLWILNPFDDNASEQAGISEKIKFWQKMKVHYKQLSNMALTELLTFASTYLCEASSSAMAVLQTKLRNRMSPDNDLIVALRIVKPRFENLISSKRARISH